VQELFGRTLSQGLQAFMPVAVFLAYARSSGRLHLLTPVRAGLVAAAPLTFIAGSFFQSSPHQSRWEAALAVFALIAACQAARLTGAFLAAATAIVVVRQTMEIDVVLRSAFALGSRDAIASCAGAAVMSAFVAFAWQRVVERLPVDRRGRAMTACASLFMLQALIYAFHESAESRLLPWSETLHAASEPYGPEGAYGRGLSGALVIVPFAVAAIASFRMRRRIVVGIAAAAAVVLLSLAVVQQVGARASAAAPHPPEVFAIAASPHVLFRHTGIDGSYSAMSLAPLERPSSRAATTLECDRVSFGDGRGICLQSDRGVFTTYRAVIFDRTFGKIATLKLEGSPSRTRVSADGRVGAVTVFLAGHGYNATGFSTRTSLIDMASGEEIADLEQFSMWRNGSRYTARDVNLWGVTFARNSNVFYATLASQNKDYLVKGDLGLRKLTVIQDDVECPSLSPDEKTIVFKRRVSPKPDGWRLYVLDVATMKDRPLAAESRYVDDQVEWLDNGHVLYAIQRPSSAASDVWLAPIDGSTTSRLYLSEASSPIVVR
jgi:hypothetical protein